MQETLYADNRHALLLIFQAMDAAGKDGAIEHVMSGVNPQGCQVYSFKRPSEEELDHDFLWRTTRALPERGRIGIFNRSYYEEVLVVRVHPGILQGQRLPADLAAAADIWDGRFTSIRDFEAHLARNGTTVVKFFLHLSKEEQRKRFLDRIDEPERTGSSHSPTWRSGRTGMPTRRRTPHASRRLPRRRHRGTWCPLITRSRRASSSRRSSSTRCAQ